MSSSLHCPVEVILGDGVIIRETGSEGHALGVKTTHVTPLPIVASGDMSRASGRNMEQFTIHITVGAQSKATFQLTYEEVLKRRLTQYDIVIKVRPKQLVHHFEVLCKSPGRTLLFLLPTPNPNLHCGFQHRFSLLPQPRPENTKSETGSSEWVPVGSSRAGSPLNLPAFLSSMAPQ